MGRFFKGIVAIFRVIFWPISLITNVVFSVIALLIFFAVAAGMFQPGPTVPNHVALVIDPIGVIVEQRTQQDPADEFFNELFGNEIPETELQDILDALDLAATDDRIKTVVLYLDNMAGAGPSTLHRIADAIDEFKDSGKSVYAVGESFFDPQYILAAQANEVIIHPFGSVFLGGYGRYRTYYREMLERLRVNVNVFRVGTFKSAVEPYLRDDMSAAAREANIGYMSVLWDNFTLNVEAARNFAPGTINAQIQNVTTSLEAAGGNFGVAALEAGYVDALMYRDEYRAYIGEVVGMDDDTGSFNQISLHEYLEAAREEEDTRGDQIAIITAAGVIVDGEAPAGAAGGYTVAGHIRDARTNDNVVAIVLRVDSPGGSAFASEVIRRELVVAREQGLPVVVSMGDLAASGGYWISTASDEIWASPTTITGSIGIFGMIPTFENSLDWAGIHRDGVGTTPLSGGVDVGRELSPVIANIIQQAIDNGYDQFVERVMEARDMTYEEVDAIAQGRVWAGATALELGLVDQLGELDDAIQSAAAMANVEDYNVVHYRDEPKQLWQQMVENFSSQAMVFLGFEEQVAAPRLPEPLATELARTWGDLRLLTQLNDPNHAYVICLECAALTQ